MPVEVTMPKFGLTMQEGTIQRYFKVPGTHDRNGTGLGLSISKEFIEAQGGHIWVSSQLGEGSQFGFNLTAA